MKFTIPLPLIGQVIGKNGSFIQSVFNKHNAVIKIMQDAPTPSMTVDERPLVVTGAIDDLLQAQELLLQRIEHAAVNYPGTCFCCWDAAVGCGNALDADTHNACCDVCWGKPGVLYRMPTQPPPGHAPDPRLYHGFEGFGPSPRESYSTGDASSSADNYPESFAGPSELSYYPTNRPDLAYVVDADYEHSRPLLPTSSPVIQAMNHMPPNPSSVELGYLYTYNVRYPPAAVHPGMPNAAAAPTAVYYEPHAGGTPPRVHPHPNGHVELSPVAQLEEAMPMLSLRWSRSAGMQQHPVRPRRPSRDMTA